MIKAKYTIVLKTLLDDSRIKPMIDTAMSTYPLYEKKSNETMIPSLVPTRDVINKKILDHYKYREIAFETVGRFIDELEITLNEIMPYYNQYFFSIDQDYNILYNVDYTRTIDIDKTGTNTNNVNENATSSSEGSNTSNASDTTTTESNILNNNKSIKSDTPQGELSINDIDDVTHASEVGWNRDNNTDSGTSTGESVTNSTSNLEGTTTNQVNATGENNENESHVETTKGNFGVVSSQDLIKKYRELIINVEKDIINDDRISELFLRIY